MSATRKEAPPATRPFWLFGAGGMLAGEFLRLAAEHPGLSLAGGVTGEGGAALRELHPQLVDPGVSVDDSSALDAIARAVDAGTEPLLVLALPQGRAATLWGELRRGLGDRAERLRLVDLSADHRLADPELHARWYGEVARTDGGRGFVYALPELARERIRGARRLAAPGCFATALQLAAVPAARAGILDAGRPWLFHAVTGSSGSGVKPLPTTHHPHRHANLRAYSIGGHRHEAELQQALRELGLDPPITFLPHSGPFARGIHLTAVLPLAQPLGPREATALFREAYVGEPFVEVLEGGVPDLRRVAGSNRASLGTAVREGQLLVWLTLDNLIKGGAGQALQGFNLMAGWPETTALPRIGWGVL